MKMNMSCEEATLLAERKQHERVSFMALVKFYLHLYHCKWCWVYVKQIAIINKFLKMGIEKKQSEIAMPKDLAEKLNDIVKSK